MVHLLADRGILLRPMPNGVKGVLSPKEFEASLDTRFGGDFEIVSIHRGLVDIPDDHFN
jgi:hypothetical protein